MASSSNRSITSSACTGSASYIRYKNRVCNCGVRAAVKISESTPNPGRLYYKCGHDDCGFWAWCNPHGGSVAEGRRDEISQWVVVRDDIIDVMKEESMVIRREMKEFVSAISREAATQVKGIQCSSVLLYLAGILMLFLIVIVLSRV